MRKKELDFGTHIVIDCEWEKSSIIYNCEIKIFDEYLQLEVSPASLEAHTLVNVFLKRFKTPMDGPRKKESYGGCGEEFPSIFAVWRFPNTTKEELYNRVVEVLNESL